MWFYVANTTVALKFGQSPSKLFYVANTPGVLKFSQSPSKLSEGVKLAGGGHYANFDRSASIREGERKTEKKKKESQRHKLCHGRLTRRTDAQHYANSLSGAPENMLVTDDSSKIAFVTDGAWNAVMLDGRDA